jgi:hypothetical protein
MRIPADVPHRQAAQKQPQRAPTSGKNLLLGILDDVTLDAQYTRQGAANSTKLS